MNRRLKQALIGGVYLAFFGAILWFGYRMIVPAPSCTDGIQNGSEQGVDCGVAACNVLCAAPILSLSVASVDILNAGTGFDVLVRIENPNPLYGASRIDYTLTVTDASGATLATRRGATYANPAQPRYLLAILLPRLALVFLALVVRQPRPADRAFEVIRLAQPEVFFLLYLEPRRAGSTGNLGRNLLHPACLGELDVQRAQRLAAPAPWHIQYLVGFCRH